jgi:hypothetical protein
MRHPDTDAEEVRIRRLPLTLGRDFVRRLYRFEVGEDARRCRPSLKSPQLASVLDHLGMTNLVAGSVASRVRGEVRTTQDVEAGPRDVTLREPLAFELLVELAEHARSEAHSRGASESCASLRDPSENRRTGGRSTSR